MTLSSRFFSSCHVCVFNCHNCVIRHAAAGIGDGIFCFSAGVVELVDTPDLGSGGESRGGSSPSARTTVNEASGAVILQADAIKSAENVQGSRCK